MVCSALKLVRISAYLSFHADLLLGTRFNGAWGRPQRDGPALRAITLIEYCNWLLDQGEDDKVSEVIWPVIANDISYVGQYW